ncbi:MAG: hypothetical protein ABJO36_09445 [Litorimonas sp.]
MNTLIDIPPEWDAPGDEDILEPDTVQLVKFLGDNLFDEYEPEQVLPFRTRLLSWLNNLTDEQEQKMLFSLLPELFFVGRKEFESLYRSLYHGPVFRWMIDTMGYCVFQDNLTDLVHEKVNSAWICPITDSLRINAFMKVTNLSCLDMRPDWRSMEKFADVEKISNYTLENDIEHLILLEDFVGSGTQVESAIRFAARALPNIKILVAPLIVCPNGDRVLSEMMANFDNVCYRPVLVLPESSMQDYKAYRGGKGTDLDRFIVSLNKFLGFNQAKSAFGYKQTGAKIVLYSNCPNNTLPIYHKNTENWKALFARVERQL